jgi:hypothetical protein
MKLSQIQEANHGWNIIFDGFTYPFTTYGAALKLHFNILLLDKFGLLAELNRFRQEHPTYKFYSVDTHKLNNEAIEGLVEKAKRKQAATRPAYPLFGIDYLDSPSMFGGARTGRTCAGASVLSNTYTRNGESPAQTADRVVNVIKSRFTPTPGLGKTVFFLSDLHLGHPKLKLNIDSVLGEKWPGDFKKFTPAYVPPASQTQQATAQASSAPVVVESIDPRKIPLLAFVNAEFLPDAPKDDTDMSTEACWKRQARTISGLLRDLEQRAEELQQERTRHENIKAGDNKCISDLLADNKSYREQVLKNADSIAVVKYSQRDHEWHLIKDGIAYKYFLGSDYRQDLLTLANSVNTGRVPMNSPALIRKAYYYKEDYA